MEPIIPFGDDEPFDVALVHCAEYLGAHDPAALTLNMLRAVGTYDLGHAVVLAQKHDAALAATVRARDTTDRASTGIPASTLAAIVDGVIRALKPLVAKDIAAERAARELAIGDVRSRDAARIAALEKQVADLRVEVDAHAVADDADR